MKSQSLRPNNWIRNRLSEKSFSQGSSCLSGSSELVKTRKEDRWEPLPIRKFASKACREDIVTSFFQKFTDRLTTNQLNHFRKTALKQKTKQI